jgi:hypothetical protein
MNTTTAGSRWHGLALVIGGVLIALALLIHPNDAADPGAVLTARWMLAHSLLLIGAIPALLGLTGMYERTGGALALIGYLLTFGSLAGFIFAFGLEALVVPVLAADATARAFLDPAGPLFGGPLGLVLLVVGLAFTVGAIVFGIAILRSGAFPRWTGPLLIVAAPVSLVPPLPYPVLLISGLALGLAFITAGVVIWSQPRPMTRQATA